MDLTAALRALVRTVERGSITGAARDLGVSQPALSKLLRNLEAHVGVRLLERGARAMRPTAQGLRLYEASSGALATIDAAVEAVRGEGGAIGGSLRLHGPVCLGESRLHAIVTAFRERHPGVGVDLILENRAPDLIHEGFDLAIRMGRPEGQEVVARRIGLVRRILVAAPAYLERRGPVPDLPALDRHDLIVTDTVLGRGGILTFQRGTETLSWPIRPVLTTNNAGVLGAALLAGHGVGTTQRHLVAGALAEGRLVRVLPDHEIRPSELYLAYPSARYLRPAVRAFADFAVARLRGIEGID